MKNWLIQFVCFTLFFTTFTAEAKSAKLLSTYEIQLGKYENFAVSQSSQFQTGVLTSRLGKNLIIAKEYAPQSINSVKLRAQENGVPAKSIQIKKWKDRALFYYETPQEFHVYSTLGGHLVIPKKETNKFDISKLGLLKKKNKMVTSL